ncbi:MAG TPA: thioesterase family protein [Terrimicrobiaceae bacterium]|nr:thioesterase family protein [Terrimicrobiaceae bacterium]
MSPIHRHPLTVPSGAIDANGHANNVEYMRWMQDAAISHADAAGCTAVTRAAGASWVVRSHHVEYLRPVFAGEDLVILTWISTLQRASSARKYLILRVSDHALAARGETHWVFVDAATGRPRAILPEIMAGFQIVPAAEEPHGWT